MTSAEGSSRSANVKPTDVSSPGQDVLPALFKIAKASTKMLMELEKTSPASALIGIWECTARSAWDEYIRVSLETGRTQVEIDDLMRKLPARF